MTSLLILLRFLGKIGLAVLGGWLISFTLIVCFVTLRPSSPEYGPDFEGLFTKWVARLLSVVIALRLMFPPRILVRADELVPTSARFTQGFEKLFFGFCAIALLGVTIGAPLLVRYDRHRAGLRWQAMQGGSFSWIPRAVCGHYWGFRAFGRLACREFFFMLVFSFEPATSLGTSMADDGENS